MGTSIAIVNKNMKQLKYLENVDLEKLFWLKVN